MAVIGAILYEPAPPPVHDADGGEGVAARQGEGERCRTGSEGQQRASGGPGAGHQAATVEVWALASSGASGVFPAAAMPTTRAGVPVGIHQGWCSRAFRYP